MVRCKYGQGSRIRGARPTTASDEISFLLPGEKMGQQWLTDLDTAASFTRPETRLAGTTVAVAAYSLQILRRV